MKFWQSLAFTELEQTAELARFCEDLGFHGVTCPDHLVTTAVQADQYLYREDGNILWNPATHWADPWVLIGHLASATTTLRFMTTVYVLPLRDPVTAAKAISTAAYLSGDRVTLGVGVGWQKAEFELCGQNFHTRGRRTDEALDILRGLMSGAMTEHHGAHYRFEPLQMSPGTRRPVPVMVGGYSDAAMRRAARCDGWLGVQHEEAELYPLLDRLARCRDELGRSAEPFEIWTGLRNPSRDAIARLREAGVTMVNGANFFDADGRARPSGIDFKKRRIEAFARQLF